MSRITAALLAGLLLAGLCPSARAAVIFQLPDSVVLCDTIIVPDSLPQLSLTASSPEQVGTRAEDTARASDFRIKKKIAAVLSFPFPFGLLGLHRVFLGTKPYIPFVYMGTVGGCFLVLPLIDFIAILSANEEAFKHYENNPKVFMWAH